MNKKILINNIKLIKALGKKHSNGQVILTRVKTLFKDDKQLVNMLSDTLALDGIMRRYNAILTVGGYLALCATNPDKKRLLPYFRGVMNSLLDRFTPFDEYVYYNVDKGKIIYSKVSLALGLKVADDLLKDLENMK